MADLDKLLKEFDPTTADPHNWTSITLGKLMPSDILDASLESLGKFNDQIDKKQRQVNKLVTDTQSLLSEVNSLTGDLKNLQKNVTDLLHNTFNTGAHYRIIGFDATISNNGLAAREVRRVLNSQLFGPTGVNPDKNFPFFLGDTARLGGFTMLWGAPSFDKLIEQFKKLGGYFPGIGDGILGAPTAFLKEFAKIPDFFKGLEARSKALTKEWEDWKKAKDPKLFDLGAFGELVPETDHWHSLSVASLIPALDPLKAGSPANQALQGVDLAFETVQSLFSVITGASATVNKLNESIQSIQGLVNSSQRFVDDVVDTVFDTGLYFHAFGSEYGASTSEEFAEVIIRALNDVDDPNRPTFQGNVAFIGGIIATVGAPDVNEFEKVFSRFSRTWQSIGLAAESWGDSFDVLVGKNKADPSTNEETKRGGVKDVVIPDEDPTIPVVIDEAEYTSRILVPEVFNVTPLVMPFFIKDEDIPPVTANNSFEYTSANNITVKVEADSRGRKRVTILESDNIITIRRSELIYIATNDLSKITSVVNPLTLSLKNYIGGEVIAREDGSIKEIKGDSIVISYPDGLKTQLREDGSSITTKADGTEETISADGSKVVKFLNGVVKYYDEKGNLVKTETPEDIETNDEIDKGQATILEDGSIEKILPNGNREVISADGKTVKTYFPDGRIKIEKEDGIVIIITESERTTNFTDGSKKIEVIEDGTLTGEVTLVAIDGTKTLINENTGVQEITATDGTVTVVYPDGSSKTIKTDGTIRTVSAITDTIVEERLDGTTITTFEDGSIKQVNSDNTFTFISRDGEVTTGTEEGEVVVENEDGSVSRVMSEGLIISRELDGTIKKENEEVGTTVTVTPQKITTETADGTIIETTDTKTVTIDDAGNRITIEISVELGSEIVDGVEREVAFKVTETITEFAEGKKVVQTEREPIYDEVIVVSNGEKKRIQIPSIRSGETQNVTTQSNFGESIEVHVKDDKGFTSIIKTEVKSGETTKERVRTEALKDRSIDKINEFEE